MSATTLNLPFKRFVAQASTAPARSKSTYLALMEENLAALQKCPWKEAADVPAALTDHDFIASTHISDAYDAFKMAGNYSASTMTEIAYAGMAAYRFKIPDSALASGSEVALSSISLPVSRDRYLKSGVRVAAVLSDSATPSADWDVVRGSGGILLSAQLPQTAAYLLAGAPGADTLELAASSFAGLAETGYDYLWIYLTLEDYTDHWDMYSEKEQRLYAIEGSAMLVGGSAKFTFDGEVEADPEPPPPSPTVITLLSGDSSPTWIQPLPTRNAGESVPGTDGVTAAENLFTPQMGGGTEAATNQILIAFPRNSTQETNGPSAYTGKIRVTIRGTDIQEVQLADGGGWSRLELQTDAYVTPAGYSYYRFYESGVVAGYTAVCLFCKVDAVQGAGAHRYALTIVPSYPSNVYVYDHRPDGSYDTYGNPSFAPRYNTTSYAFVGSAEFTAFTVAPGYCLLLQFSGGVPVGADRCSSPDASTRQNATWNIEETETETGAAWTVTIAGVSYSVTKSGASVTMKSAGGIETLGQWTLTSASGQLAFFDASVSLWMTEESLRVYGAAATLGDFSHAVVSFEGGTQPSQAEMLGRLARNSRRNVGGMLYLHPARGALADELDALRPVPRFFRAASTPTKSSAADSNTQWLDSCQPGLSVWYKRPSSGSGYERKLAYRNGVTAVTSITNPVFLQYTLLAVRASAVGEGMSLVLTNVGSGEVANGFDLRFAVWRSPAEEWDGSNNFALSAIVAAPCLYRADGTDDVSWTVDCGGTAFPFGSRTVHARRLGVSPVVSGDIDVDDEIAIPLSGALEDADVLLIAPVVLGFAAGGAGGSSVYFGRRSDPASATTGWARYDTDIGWFPQITLQQSGV